MRQPLGCGQDGLGAAGRIAAPRLGRRPGGFGRPQGYFVQCNQADCQYVDENKLPCPLTATMFADEIKAAEEARAQRSE